MSRSNGVLSGPVVTRRSAITPVSVTNPTAPPLERQPLADKRVCWVALVPDMHGEWASSTESTMASEPPNIMKTHRERSVSPANPRQPPLEP